MKPLHDRVIVKRKQSEAETSFGFILDQDPTDECEVIAVGDDVTTLRAGDICLIGRNIGQAIEHNEDWLTIVTEEDVLAVLEN